MDFCNYNWNIMNLSLLVAFDTLLRLHESSEGIREHIEIVQQKNDFSAMFRKDWESTNFKLLDCVSYIYDFYVDEETVDEETMKIDFQSLLQLWSQIRYD